MSEDVGTDGGTFNLSKEIEAANLRLPLDTSATVMPLEMTVRSMALAIAQRHCGDTTVKEGNLYQQLKMDNKLMGPLTVSHVMHAALIFERFLWGEFSKGLVKDAMKSALDEADEVMKDHFDAEDPTRHHGGGDGP